MNSWRWMKERRFFERLEIILFSFSLILYIYIYSKVESTSENNYVYLWCMFISYICEIIRMKEKKCVEQGRLKNNSNTRETH